MYCSGEGSSTESLCDSCVRCLQQFLLAGRLKLDNMGIFVRHGIPLEDVLAIARNAYGRTFFTREELLAFLGAQTSIAPFEPLVPELASTSGVDFQNSRELFLFLLDGYVPDTGALKRPKGGPSEVEVARNFFGADFSGTQELDAYLAAVHGRELDFVKALKAAGWRAERKKTAARIRLSTAERLLKRFLDLVPVVNRGADFSVRIKRVLLFGSVLARKERVNDIDLCIETESKPGFESSSLETYDGAVEWALSYLTDDNERFHFSAISTIREGRIAHEVVFPTKRVTRQTSSGT
jgi:predicted nucleotidyltransferase